MARIADLAEACQIFASKLLKALNHFEYLVAARIHFWKSMTVMHTAPQTFEDTLELCRCRIWVPPLAGARDAYNAVRQSVALSPFTLMPLRNHDRPSVSLRIAALKSLT